MKTRPRGRREIELVLSAVVIVYGVRTSLPLTAAAAGRPLWGLILFGCLVLLPGVMLLFSVGKLRWRQNALLGVLGSNIYVTLAILGNDWTRWGSAAASLGLSGIAFILYLGARAEGRRP